MNIRQKYPRTPHLPWSRPDETDVWMDENFDPELEVVITEKLDGENTTIYADHSTHARSMDSKDHPSRHWMKAQAAALNFDLEYALLGENVFAKHSIYYDSLDTWFYLFGVRTEEVMLPWDTVVKIGDSLGLAHVPILWRGKWKNFKHEYIWPRPSLFGEEAEGYVVRNADAFYIKDFRKNVAKYVRPNHVQTDQHWTRQPMIVNGVK